MEYNAIIVLLQRECAINYIYIIYNLQYITFLYYIKLIYVNNKLHSEINLCCAIQSKRRLKEMSKPDPKKAVKKKGRYEMNISWDRISSEIDLGKPKITVYEELKADNLYSYGSQSFLKMYTKIKKEKDANQKRLMDIPQPAIQERSKGSR